MADRLRKKAEESVGEMNGILSEVDVDQINLEGITIRCGNRVLKLEVASNEPIAVEDEMREELREKLRDRLQEIKNRLNAKITEMVEFTSQIREEAEKKERELKRQLSQSVAMPEVNWKHAQSGLSVVKGRGKNNLIWLVQGVYQPKFVDDSRIEPRYAKKLISPVVFMIKSEGKYIKEITTRKPLGLEYFSHYHQHRPDCWGNWQKPSEWSQAEDIINIARQAEAVLEKVNSGSAANSSPRGLPRLNNLQKHVTKKKRVKEDDDMDSSLTRMGASSRRMRSLDDVWEA